MEDAIVSDGFGDLTIDGFIDTGASTIAFSEAHLENVGLLAPQRSSYDRPYAKFQIRVASGHLEMPTATVELHFEVGDIL